MLKARQNLDQETQYMYGSSAQAVESKRLRGHNLKHNPLSVSFFSPAIQDRKNILEIACGAGQMGLALMSYADPSAQYLGIDRDQSQVEMATETHKTRPSSKILKVDVLTEEGQSTIRQQGQFDLIFIRWFLVHLPKEKKIPFLAFLMSLLSENGILICEECDNSEVKYQPKISSEATAEVQQYSDKATQAWFAVYDGLERKLGNDLKYSAKKMCHDFHSASKLSSTQGVVEQVGNYQVVYGTQEEKELITNGYQAHGDALIREVTGQALEEIMLPGLFAAKREDIEMRFLRENIVSFRRTR